MQNTDPIVSVIVPIYNVEHYLQRCIDSIREQTYKQLEIILVDDGSPDDCGRICDYNTKLDVRIVAIHKENGGLSSARNAGLDIAKGEYVAFVDGDDTIHPKFIEALTELCTYYECDIAQCDYLTVAEGFSKLPLNTLQSIKIYNGRQALYEQCCTKNAAQYTIACNKVYRKELFQNIRYPLGKIHEDEFTTYLLLWKAERIAITNQYMYYYLQRVASIMGTTFSAKRLDALEAFQERLEFLKDRDLWEEYEGTLRTIIRFVANNYMLLRGKGKASEVLCTILLHEKETAENLLFELTLKKTQLLRKRICFRQSKIVLYGAGHWGNLCYQWIKKNQWGTVVGWVDNLWNQIKEVYYPIKPINDLMNISFDYVLIAIQDRQIQEEVAENLMSWGIPEEKIITTAIFLLGDKDV